MTVITINGNTLDPVTEASGIRLAGLDGAMAPDSEYALVQMQNPTPDQKAQLEAAGAHIFELVSEDTYLCSLKSHDLVPVQTLPFVITALAYNSGFKVSSSLKPESTTSILGARPTTSLSRSFHQVDVNFHEDVDGNTDQRIADVAAAARVDRNGLQVSGNRIRLFVQERYLPSLAELDHVREVLEVHPLVLHNNQARKIINADLKIDGVGYDGKDQVIAVADTGFDTGSTTDCLPAFAGRVKKIYALGRPRNGDDPAGHGTHVSGTVLGDGTSTSMGGRIQGAAPAASLVMQSLLDANGGLGGIPINLADLFGPPYTNDGARVHTNSWGSDVGSQLPYGSHSRDIDDYVWNNPNMTICFAAGNAGLDANHDGIVDPAQIGAEAAAKNCITVGACESSRTDIPGSYGTFWPSRFSALPIRDDPTANNPDGMAAFSSRGPTSERRLKPDIVAPGTSILSARSRRVLQAHTSFGESTDTQWMFDSGTSMATPLVAGCAAVVRQSLVATGITNPSAARIKALLINGADDLVGQYVPTEAGSSPNNNSGFGRVNLGSSIVILGATPNAGCGEGRPLSQGQEDTITITIGKPSAASTKGQTLKITLVWTDPSGPMLQNDLDLIVKAPDGSEQHGNVGASPGFDRTNNVEQVTWTNVPTGDMKVTIRAFKITRFPQPYAYAWRII